MAIGEPIGRGVESLSILFNFQPLLLSKTSRFPGFLMVSILFNPRSFQKPDPFLKVCDGFLERSGPLERMEMEGGPRIGASWPLEIRGDGWYFNQSVPFDPWISPPTRIPKGTRERWIPRSNVTRERLQQDTNSRDRRDSNGTPIWDGLSELWTHCWQEEPFKGKTVLGDHQFICEPPQCPNVVVIWDVPEGSTRKSTNLTKQCDSQGRVPKGNA